MKKHLINRSRLLLGGLFGVIVLLSILQITVSNFFTTDGINLESIQTQIQAYQKDNIKLKEEVYTASSLTDISVKAATMGFTPEKNNIALGTTRPLAIRQ